MGVHKTNTGNYHDNVIPVLYCGVNSVTQACAWGVGGGGGVGKVKQL